MAPITTDYPKGEDHFDEIGLDRINIHNKFDVDITIPVPQALQPNKTHFVVRLQRNCVNFVRTHSTAIRYFVALTCLLAYVAYVLSAVSHSLELARPLLIVTSLVLAILVYIAVRDNFGGLLWGALGRPADRWIDRRWHWLKWVVYAGLLLGLVNYLAFSVITTWRQLQSAGGMVFFLFITWATSRHRDQIKWRPVIWGLAMQFVIGVLVLRWKPGYEAVKWLSQQINTIIFYSLAGSGPAFGDPWFFLHPFLMLVVPLILYVGAVVSIFYYFGWIQKFAAKLGWLMDKTLRTTAIESVTIAVNIFLSVFDTVLMIKPYVKKLTESEFHCFLVGAHSTIAGFAFGLFVIFGVKPQHLLTGAVMSAPAAIAVAKLNWPETEESFFKPDTEFQLDGSDQQSFFRAFLNGAWDAAKGGISILIQVLAFMAMFSFMNDVIGWFGSLVGVHLSIDLMFGYLFYPLAYVLGIDIPDILDVGVMMGMKVIANEFLAFVMLGQAGRTDQISERSQAIATYAMCGFSSFGTLFIMTGVWNTVDPTKTSQVVQLVPRIMMNSNIACFLTACIAGIFYNDDIVEDASGLTEDQERFLLMQTLIPKFKDIQKLLPNL